MGSAGDFLRELRRRRVFREAAVYIVVAWLIIQVAQAAFEGWGVPIAAIRMVWIGLMLGFPVALVFGWIFDFTTEGVVRTPPADQGAAMEMSLQRTDFVLLGTLGAVLIAISFGVARKVLETPTDEPSEVVAPIELVLGVAALPFENLSPNPDNAFFAGGVHEEILTHLSRIAELRVISRTSMQRVAEMDLEVPAIGERLGVSHVLEGSVRRAGDQVRITVQLIDASTDAHVWSENYDRTLTDIFAIQSEIALAIARQLRAELTPDAVANIEEIPTDNTEAYDLYLQALAVRHDWQSNTLTMFGSDIRPLLERSVALDPNFLQAQVALAETYGRIAFSAASPAVVSEFSAKALEVVTNIRRRWPDRIESRLALGHYYYLVDLDPERALVEYRAVEVILPNNAEVVESLSYAFKRTGRFNEYLRAARLAKELTPESYITRASLLLALWWSGSIDESLAIARANIQMFPERDYLRTRYAWYRLMQLGDVEAYLAEADRLRGEREAYSTSSDFDSDLTWLLYDRGDIEAALESIEVRRGGDLHTLDAIEASIDHTQILRLEGRDDEAQAVADRTLIQVTEWIESSNPPGGNSWTAENAIFALAAALAGDDEALAKFRARDAAIAQGGYLQNRWRAYYLALADAAAGDPEAGWARITPYLLSHSYYTPEYLMVAPQWRAAFGEVPGYQDYIAQAEPASDQ
jgi:TolB-like protein